MPRPGRPERFPDAATLAVCEAYGRWLRQSSALRLPGRPSGEGTAGLDFLGYSPYRSGDDLRHLDWTLYGRHRGFFVRRYADEAAGTLLVLLDGSGSMGVGAPPKWSLARSLAAVLVYAALRENHRVLVAVAQGDRSEALPLSGGFDFVHTALRFLGDARPIGPTHLGAAFGRLPVAGSRGHAVLISDFFDPHGAAAGIDAVRRQGFAVDAVRVSAPGEVELPPGGLGLFDPEGPGHARAPGLATERARLAGRLAAWREATELAARRAGALLVEVSSDASLPGAVDRVLRSLSRAATEGPRGGR